MRGELGAQAEQICGGRLESITGTQIGMFRYNDDWIHVNDRQVNIGSGLIMNTTDNTLDFFGEAVSPPFGETTYYLYVSNDLVRNNPNQLRASTIAPTYVDNADGSRLSRGRYLGRGPISRNWLMVGMARMNNAFQVLNTETQRLLSNWYNRRRLPMRILPGYVNDDAVTQFAFNSGTWTETAPIAGGAAGIYISNGEDPVEFHAQMTATVAAGQNLYFGIADNRVDSVKVAALLGGPAATLMSEQVHWIDTPPEGTRSVALLGANIAPAITITADIGRNGDPEDVPASYLIGTVWG